MCSSLKVQGHFACVCKTHKQMMMLILTCAQLSKCHGGLCSVGDSIGEYLEEEADCTYVCDHSVCTLYVQSTFIICEVPESVLFVYSVPVSFVCGQLTFTMRMYVTRIRHITTAHSVTVYVTFHRYIG